jgi:hypothetical protein
MATAVPNKEDGSSCGYDLYNFQGSDSSSKKSDSLEGKVGLAVSFIIAILGMSDSDAFATLGMSDSDAFATLGMSDSDAFLADGEGVGTIV